jgi:hypothetical protein
MKLKILNKKKREKISSLNALDLFLCHQVQGISTFAWGFLSVLFLLKLGMQDSVAMDAACLCWTG